MSMPCLPRHAIWDNWEPGVTVVATHPDVAETGHIFLSDDGHESLSEVQYR